MSLEPGAYRITNLKAPELTLTLSNDRLGSVIAGGDGPPNRQTWIVRYTDEGRVKIMSAANGLFLGFPGTSIPMPWEGLIVGGDDIAKDWEVIRDGPGYKFKLPNTPLVIQFPQENLQPGVPAQLGPMVFQAANQVWTMIRVDDDDDDDVDDSEDED